MTSLADTKHIFIERLMAHRTLHLAHTTHGLCDARALCTGRDYKLAFARGLRPLASRELWRASRSDLRRVLHARVWSDYYRFPIKLHWYLQFIYCEMKFWCCPGVRHLHPILKPPTLGFLYERPAPPWSICSFSEKKKKRKNARKMPLGMGTLGIDWAINSAILILITSRALCTGRHWS